MIMSSLFGGTDAIPAEWLYSVEARQQQQTHLESKDFIKDMIVEQLAAPYSVK
jgi:hypothetical protein